MCTSAPVTRSRPSGFDHCADGTALKVCSRCRVELPLDSFRSHKGFKQNLHNECRRCDSARDALRDPATRHGNPRSIAQRKRVCRPLPKADREALNALRAFGCAVCDGPADHRDHIVPISRGGQHTLANLRWLCTYHNTSKGNKLDSEWSPS